MATFVKRGGKYLAVIRRKGCPTVCRTFHTKSDAEQWARLMELKADRRDLPASMKVLDTLRVKDVLERYRDEVIPQKRGAKVETYILNAFLRQPLNKLTLAQITPAHFTAYRERRLKEVAPVTINRELGIVRHAFDIAMQEWDMLYREPVDMYWNNWTGVKLPERNAYISGFGKSAQFDGIISLNCNDAKHSWITASNSAIETCMTESEINQIVPPQTISAAFRAFCK